MPGARRWKVRAAHVLPPGVNMYIAQRGCPLVCAGVSPMWMLRYGDINVNEEGVRQSETLTLSVLLLLLYEEIEKMRCEILKEKPSCEK
jgi:hypothetical protein